jgi:hypothetical protein
MNLSLSKILRSAMVLVSLSASAQTPSTQPQAPKGTVIDWAPIEQAALTAGKKKGLPNGYKDTLIAVTNPSDKVFTLQGDTDVQLVSHRFKAYNRATVNGQISWDVFELEGGKSSTIAPKGLKSIKAPNCLTDDENGSEAVLVKLELGTFLGDPIRQATIPESRWSRTDGGMMTSANQETYNPSLGQKATIVNVGFRVAKDSPYTYEKVKWAGELIVLEKPLSPGHYAIVAPLNNEVWDFDVVE